MGFKGAPPYDVLFVWNLIVDYLDVLIILQQPLKELRVFWTQHMPLIGLHSNCSDGNVFRLQSGNPEV